MAKIYKDFGHLGQQQEQQQGQQLEQQQGQQQGQPYNSPGRLADHLAPETAPRPKNVEDSDQSHFSSSALIEANIFHRKN